jgi:hypothetical protein
MKIALWVFERIIEAVLGSIVLLLVLGSNANPSFPGVLGDIQINMMFVAMFYLMSGYVFTTFFLEVAARARSSIAYIARAAGLFLVHAAIFMALNRGFSIQAAIEILAGGACAVVTASSLGFLAGRSLSRSQP